MVIPYVAANWDPYQILGVRKDANLDQIKKAYRELARKLHPDKSNLNEDDANRRFIDLNKAFNILKDPAKRSRFDQHGETEDSRHSRGYHQGGHQHQNRQTKEYWVHNGFYSFHSSIEGLFRKKSITAKQYYNDYLKESKQKPFFIFFYSEFCPSCTLVESAWTKITNELARYNIGSFTINVYHESRLAHELGVDSIPFIACLIDGQVHPYYQSEISLSSIVKFIKSLLPDNLVPLLKTEYEQDRFISIGPQVNRLSVLVVNEEKVLKLRYLLLAYELRRYYRFSHVSTKLSDYSLLARRYNLTTKSDNHILVFDEHIRRPLMHFNFKPHNLDINYLRKQLTKWPFLKLPKLTSQRMFDDLCLYSIPKDGDQTQTRLCVILFANETPSSLSVREKMIEFIKLNNLEHNDKVVFAYIDPNKQSEFVQSLLLETDGTQPSFIRESIDSSVILIERHLQNSRKAKYRWINARWNPKRPDELDRASIELYQFVNGYKQDLFSPQNKVVITPLADEEGPSLLDRILWRFINNVGRFMYYVSSRDSFSAIIVLIACACITSVFLYNSPISAQIPVDITNSRQFEVPNNSTKQAKPWSPDFSSQRVLDDDLRIIELKAETYNGMVRLLKPGFRSIILLTDHETIHKLLPNFRKAVWPYRRNKTLLFGYLCLDKNLNWYKSLLEEVLGVDGLNVNKKNCIGTVLSLNGFKKYLRVYHAKHHEIDQYDDDTDNDGSFLGFNEDDCQNDVERGSFQTTHETVYTVDNLLDRLPIWLDKVFDGLTKRYFLDRWPEDIK